MWPLTRTRKRRRRRKRGLLSLLFRGRPARRERTSFYRSAAWIRLREQCKAENCKWWGRETPTCERCAWWAGTWMFWRKRKIHVDHVKPRSLYPKFELDERFLQCLCDLCNIVKGNRTTWHWKRMRRWWFIYAPFRFLLLWYQRLVLGWKA